MSIDMSMQYTDADAIAAAVARNLAALRAARGLSFDQLAARSGVSKGMLVQIEQGRTNPSLLTLCRVASALGVTIARMVEPAPSGLGRVLRAEDFNELWRGRADSRARLLAGLDGARLVELWDWRLAPGESYGSEAHPPGSAEMLLVLAGRLAVEVGAETFVAGKGEAITFEAGHPHRYACRGPAAARFIMVVVEPRRRGAPQAPPS
ncbi:MAG TPA: XRE family transcriptional regulator [Dongiaceae bacterium]|nr:XRE family transcriptional regulator [Dongiaceae bacterium]